MKTLLFKLYISEENERLTFDLPEVPNDYVYVELEEEEVDSMASTKEEYDQYLLENIEKEQESDNYWPNTLILAFIGIKTANKSKPVVPLSDLWAEGTVHSIAQPSYDGNPNFDTLKDFILWLGYEDNNISVVNGCPVGASLRASFENKRQTI